MNILAVIMLVCACVSFIFGFLTIIYEHYEGLKNTFSPSVIARCRAKKIFYAKITITCFVGVGLSVIAIVVASLN